MKKKALAIAIIIIIITLSFFDAPEFPCCNHIGVCEFLELSGKAEDALKSSVIRFFSSYRKNENVKFFTLFLQFANFVFLTKRLDFICIVVLLHYTRIFFHLMENHLSMLKDVQSSSYSANTDIFPKQFVNLIGISIITS